MGMTDNIHREWSQNSVRFTKEELYIWRDANWSNDSTSLAAVGAVISFAGFIQLFSISAYVLSTVLGFSGMGGYLGNQIDDILRDNNCENGINLNIEVEITENVNFTEVLAIKITDVRVA
jgi:hypothetical protein